MLLCGVIKSYSHDAIVSAIFIVTSGLKRIQYKCLHSVIIIKDAMIPKGSATARVAVADPGGARGMRTTPSWSSISLIYVEFSANILPNNRLKPPSGPGHPGSATGL